MAEEATHQEDQRAEAAEQPPVYHVQNTVRRQSTRLHRARSGTRHRFKLFIGARRLLRNQKMPLTEAEFQKHQEQIRQMVLDGQIALFLPNGIRVTSLPDGRLVYTKPNGAVKVDEEPQPQQAPPPPSGDSDDGGDPSADDGGDTDETQEPEEDEGAGGEDTEVDPSQPDDLTTLTGIGPGRARKLAEAGVESYAQLVERGPEGVSELLGVTEEQAVQICSAAAELMGGSDGEG